MGEPDRIIGTRVFGGYAITRKIGEGGMGAVYIAENIELQKKLAVKVLLPDRLSSKSAASRFLAEARAASAINHRNIIDILDSSTLPDGRHYILMEYLDGTTLRRYARGIGPMPVDVVLAIMAQVCSGLQAAHDRGIVHRDLKPSNIFLAPQPDNPYFAKVLDFGIAKLDDPNLAGDVETKSHTVAGTPNYMAPEQARALRDVDHRADVYSCGAMIYELLTGTVPYKAASIGDLTYKQASTTPPTVTQIRPDISPAWDALVMKSLAMEPDARTPTASELAFQMIAATEHGEAIARATASMLFAPASSSSSAAPRDRSHRQIENEPPNARSITASLGEGRPPPMALGSDFSNPKGALETRAATPGAMARSPSAPASAPSAQALRHHGRNEQSFAGGLPPESPTTLGMSASPVQFVVDRPTPWAKVTAIVILIAALTAIALVLLTDSSPSEPRGGAGSMAPDDGVEEAPSTPTATDPVPDPVPDPKPTVAPLAGVDAGVAAEEPDAAPIAIVDEPTETKSTKAGKGKSGKSKGKSGKNKGKSGKSKGKSGDGDSEGDLFDTRK